ncbi:unnamed protein product [Closterium sp. Naga37s-1]|nr:unnamed protein product [Closterium sp. Naga37s-1]
MSSRCGVGVCACVRATRREGPSKGGAVEGRAADGAGRGHSGHVGAPTLPSHPPMPSSSSPTPLLIPDPSSSSPLLLAVPCPLAPTCTPILLAKAPSQDYLKRSPIPSRYSTCSSYTYFCPSNFQPRNTATLFNKAFASPSIPPLSPPPSSAPASPTADVRPCSADALFKGDLRGCWVPRGGAVAHGQSNGRREVRDVRKEVGYKGSLLLLNGAGHCCSSLLGEEGAWVVFIVQPKASKHHLPSPITHRQCSSFPSTTNQPCIVEPLTSILCRHHTHALITEHSSLLPCHPSALPLSPIRPSPVTHPPFPCHPSALPLSPILPSPVTHPPFPCHPSALPLSPIRPSPVTHPPFPLVGITERLS